MIDFAASVPEAMIRGNDEWRQDAEVSSMIDAVATDDDPSPAFTGIRSGGLISIEPKEQKQYLLKRGDPWPWRKERIAKKGRPKGEGPGHIAQISVLGEVRDGRLHVACRIHAA